MIRNLWAIAALLCAFQGFAQEAVEPTLPLPDEEAGAAAASKPASKEAADPSSTIGFNGKASVYRLTMKAGVLNRLTFEHPFAELVLSPDFPATASKKLKGDQTVIFEIDPKATGEYQGTVQLVDGSLVELVIRMDAGVPPLSWTQPSTTPFGESNPASRLPVQRAEDNWFKSVFERLVAGEIPEEFGQIEPPEGGQIGNLRAEYIAAMRNEDYVILVVRLHSRVPGWISEQDLFAPGVKAVLLDGQQVGQAVPPVAYVVMAAE